MTEQELQNHDLQIENTRAVDDYMRSKYTNGELYGWMVGQLSSVYFQSYKLAYDVDGYFDDARVLGSDQFLSSLSTKLFRPRLPLSLEQLAQSVCHSHGVPIDLLRSASRSSLLTATRVEIATGELRR